MSGCMKDMNGIIKTKELVQNIIFVMCICRFFMNKFNVKIYLCLNIYVKYRKASTCQLSYIFWHIWSRVKNCVNCRHQKRFFLNKKYNITFFIVYVEKYWKSKVLDFMIRVVFWSKVYIQNLPWSFKLYNDLVICLISQ